MQEGKQSEEALELLGQMWQEGPEPKCYHVPRSHQRMCECQAVGTALGSLKRSGRLSWSQAQSSTMQQLVLVERAKQSEKAVELLERNGGIALGQM